MSFPVELVRGVPVLVHGARRILLDTGAPVMVGRGPEFTFLRRSYDLVPDFCGATVETLSGYLGGPMDVLAGVPLFLDHAVRFDWSAGTVGFAERPGTDWGERLEVGVLHGCPTIEIAVGEEPLRVFLDTGAAISYLPEAVFARGAPGGPYEDFHPLGGPFTTPTVTIRHRIGNETVEARSGRLESLPSALRGPLEIDGMAIVGMSALRPLGISFDLGRGAIHVAPRPDRGPRPGAAGVP